MTLQITDAQLRHALKTHIKTNKGLEKALTYLKRSARMKYVETIMEPLLSSALNGTMLHVGESKEPTLFVPVIGFFSLDSKQAYDFASCCYHNTGNMNCRFCYTCTKQFWSKRQEVGSERGDVETEIFCSEASSISKVQMKETDRGLTDEDKDVLSCIKSLNIIPVENPLFRLFRYHSSRGAMTLLNALCPDKLHVVDKGAVEDALRGSLCTIYLWGERVKGAPQDPIGNLDYRAEKYRPLGPFHGFGDRTLKLTFSSAVKKTSKKAMSKGAMSGGCMDAKRIVQALYQLTLCIGVSGSIIPNKKVHLGGDYSINPTAVILNACFSALELHLAVSGDYYRVEDICYLSAVTKHCNLQLRQLFRLKERLLNNPEFNTKLPAVIKAHLSEHFPTYIVSMGAPRVFDTEIMEHQHIVDVHKAAPRTSYNTTTIETEMLQASEFRRRSVQVAEMVSHQADALVNRRRVVAPDGIVSSNGLKSNDVRLYYVDSSQMKGWHCGGSSENVHGRLHFHQLVGDMKGFTRLMDEFEKENGDTKFPFHDTAHGDSPTGSVLSTSTWADILKSCKQWDGEYQLINCAQFSPHSFHLGESAPPSSKPIHEKNTFNAFTKSNKTRAGYDFVDCAWTNETTGRDDST